MCFLCSALVLVDKKGNNGLVHYLKNIEGVAYLAPRIYNSINTAKTNPVN